VSSRTSQAAVSGASRRSEQLSEQALKASWPLLANVLTYYAPAELETGAYRFSVGYDRPPVARHCRVSSGDCPRQEVEPLNKNETSTGFMLAVVTRLEKMHGCSVRQIIFRQPRRHVRRRREPVHVVPVRCSRHKTPITD